MSPRNYLRLAGLMALPLVLVAASVRAAPLAVVPLEPYVGKLVTIPVRIGDVETSFLFDTAGGATCVTPEVAAQLGCEPYGGATGFRFTGERVTMTWCGERHVEVGGVAQEVMLSVFDLMRLLGELPEVGGLASVHTFADQPFSLDVDGGRLVLESEASLAARVRSARPIRARFAHQAGGASLDPFVAVDAPRGVLWMELDSGNIGRTLLAPHAVTQLGFPTQADTVAPLRVVGLEPASLQLRVVDSCIYDGVLSLEVFRDRVFTFDPATDRIWAQ